jgi:predicted ATP-grasp superfamily ATP-dependent carboligase
LSRYTSRIVDVPDNLTDSAGFAAALLELVPGHDVLLPMGMHAINPVARCLDAFTARTRLALAPAETIDRADNTPQLLGLARELGIPVPAQWKVGDYASPGKLAEAVRYPAFVKIGIEAGLAPGDRYAIAANAAELTAAVERLSAYNPDPIIQECLTGPGIGFEVLYDFEHRPVARFAHRRLRQYPLEGGPSTYCVSIHDARAEKYSLRLLDHLRWTGLAMVEFKIDERTGTPVLMEINPRPWGSMQLAIHAGVEFPWLWYQLARDGKLPVQPDWPDGVRLRYFANDARAALAEAHRAHSLGAKAAIIGSLFDPRVAEGVFSWRDPRPSWAYLAKAFRRAVGGGHVPGAAA